MRDFPSLPLGPVLSRMGDLGRFRSPMNFEDFWALVVYSTTSHGAGFLQTFLWQYKLAAWVTKVLEERLCHQCGSPLERYARSNKIWCSSPCKLKAHRGQHKGVPFPVVALSLAARDQLDSMDQQLDRMRAHRVRLQGPTVVIPPDLTTLDALPVLPDRCGNCVTSSDTCEHTAHICLFGATRS